MEFIPRTATSASRVGWTYPLSSIARDAIAAGLPSNRQARRKRVKATGSRGSCSWAAVQVRPLLVGDLDALDPPAPRPGEAGQLVDARARQRLTAGRKRDDRLRFHLIGEDARLAVGHQVRVLRRFVPGHVGLIGELQAVQPLHVRVAFPPRNDEAQRVSLRGTNRFAVLPVREQDVLHRLLERDAALHPAGIGAFRDHPRRAWAHTHPGQHERQRHSGPLAAADEAIASLNVGPRGRRPLARAVAAAFEHQRPRHRRQAFDLGHRQ